MKRTIVCVSLLTVLLSSLPAQASETRNQWAEFGLGVAAVAINVAYVPAKIVYAMVGGLVGAMALGVTAGNMRAADEVWSPTLSGDYVVTSGMLCGERPLQFVGPSYSATQPDF